MKVMTIEEAETLDDFIAVYKRHFGKRPILSEGKGTDFDLIDDITNAIRTNQPLDRNPDPVDAKL